MPGDKVAKGSDDMMIDEHEQKQVNAVDGFNSQYLKIYYGKQSLFLFH